jgi:hypothetical protein
MRIVRSLASPTFGDFHPRAITACERNMATTRLEIFAAFVALFPLLSREDLEATVEMLRGSPGYARALEHARIQAAEMGLSDALLETTTTVNAADFEAHVAFVATTIRVHS